jgi:hypothetical protein
MGPLVIVKVLPLLELLIKELCVVNDNPFEHPIELFLVDPMAPFDLSIKPRSPGFDINMVDAFIQHMPVELALKLRAVIAPKPRKKARAAIFAENRLKLRIGQGGEFDG